MPAGFKGSVCISPACRAGVPLSCQMGLCQTSWAVELWLLQAAGKPRHRVNACVVALEGLPTRAALTLQSTVGMPCCHCRLPCGSRPTLVVLCIPFWLLSNIQKP